MDEAYAEYKCTACKKEIKNIVAKCKNCDKVFLHPGCTAKHKAYNRSREYVQCGGPFEKFVVDSEWVAEMKKTPVMERKRIGSTGSAGVADPSGELRKASSIDLKIDWIVKTIKEMRDEVACKNEIKLMIKEVVREEIGNYKKEIQELIQTIERRNTGIERAEGNTRMSYSNAVKERKKENIIIIKPNTEQESEKTKKLVKEKINIKNMEVGITKLRKGNKGSVILGCDTGEEMEKLKTTVQATLGENFKVMEPQKRKPKLKIIAIGEDEMKLDDEDLLDTIKKQNRISGETEMFYMKLIKRIIKEKTTRGGNGGGSVIIETDEQTHELMLRKEKINLGWRKCFVYNYVNVKRCFNCWGYSHIAKYCTRQETCHKCAGNHKTSECKTKKARCVNCMYKIQAYNVKISDEHDALDPECPTYRRALEEEKRRIGWDG